MNIRQILTLCVVSIKCMYIQFNLISYQIGMLFISFFRGIQIFFLLGNHHHWKPSSTRGCLFCAYENSNVTYEQPIWMYLYIPVHVSVAYWNKDWCTLLNWHKYILINVNIYLVHNKIKIPWYKCYGFYCAVYVDHVANIWDYRR